MCGISFKIVKSDDDSEEITDSIERIKHRGPDGQGIYSSTVGKYSVQLGHARLSILDLSELGGQPMVKDNTVIVFNGEIYNHKQLRGKLEKLNHSFRSLTDTEVILSLYSEYGEQAFKMLTGMFAFALLDISNCKFFAVRDTVGIKPLYIHSQNGEYFGSSEIKGLKAFNRVDFSLSRDDLFEFMHTGFLYEPDTGFENIKKIRPSTYLKLCLNTGLEVIESYKHTADVDSASSGIEDRLATSLKGQLRADVPIGLFFSGGVDSSILAGLAKSLSLIFASYDDDASSNVDKKYSQKIADYLNKDMSVIVLESTEGNADEIINSFDFVAKHSEELISDYTFWSTFKLSQAARAKGFKVMLSGMGGDEAFAGYPRYLVAKHDRLVRALAYPLLKLQNANIYPQYLAKKIERLVSYSQERNWALAYSRLLGYFSKKEIKNLFGDHANLLERYRNKLDKIGSSFEGDKHDRVKFAQHFDSLGFLSHNLSVTDKASMLASIEMRVPILDEDLVKLGKRMSTNNLIRGRALKFPLRELLKTLIPKKLIERPKTGFNPPLDGLILKIGHSRILNELQSLNAVFEKEQINLIVADHFKNNKNNTYKIWQMLYLAKWLKWNTNENLSENL